MSVSVRGSVHRLLSSDICQSVSNELENGQFCYLWPDRTDPRGNNRLNDAK